MAWFTSLKSHKTKEQEQLQEKKMQAHGKHGTKQKQDEHSHTKKWSLLLVKP